MFGSSGSSLSIRPDYVVQVSFALLVIYTSTPLLFLLLFPFLFNPFLSCFIYSCLPSSLRCFLHGILTGKFSDICKSLFDRRWEWRYLRVFRLSSLPPSHVRLVALGGEGREARRRRKGVVFVGRRTRRKQREGLPADAQFTVTTNSINDVINIGHGGLVTTTSGTTSSTTGTTTDGSISANSSTTTTCSDNSSSSIGSNSVMDSNTENTTPFSSSPSSVSYQELTSSSPFTTSPSSPLLIETAPRSPPSSSSLHRQMLRQLHRYGGYKYSGGVSLSLPAASAAGEEEGGRAANAVGGWVVGLAVEEPVRAVVSRRTSPGYGKKRRDVEEAKFKGRADIDDSGKRKKEMLHVVDEVTTTTGGGELTDELMSDFMWWSRDGLDVLADTEKHEEEEEEERRRRERRSGRKLSWWRSDSRLSRLTLVEMVTAGKVGRGGPEEEGEGGELAWRSRTTAVKEDYVNARLVDRMEGISPTPTLVVIAGDGDDGGEVVAAGQTSSNLTDENTTNTKQQTTTDLSIMSEHNENNNTDTKSQTTTSGTKTTTTNGDWTRRSRVFDHSQFEIVVHYGCNQRSPPPTLYDDGSSSSVGWIVSLVDSTSAMLDYYSHCYSASPRFGFSSSPPAHLLSPCPPVSFIIPPVSFWLVLSFILLFVLLKKPSRRSAPSLPSLHLLFLQPFRFAILVPVRLALLLLWICTQGPSCALWGVLGGPSRQLLHCLGCYGQMWADRLATHKIAVHNAKQEVDKLKYDFGEGGEEGGDDGFDDGGGGGGCWSLYSIAGSDEESEWEDDDERMGGGGGSGSPDEEQEEDKWNEDAVVDNKQQRRPEGGGRAHHNRDGSDNEQEEDEWETEVVKLICANVAEI
eukprot:GHVS01034060.1.p1 GENE.GHVS01034060.1~~GHVS01034060.1.p1  ORF type:complete len:859 (-),score=266.18 GHVS01034060.1:1215-3791(-)